MICVFLSLMDFTADDHVWVHPYGSQWYRCCSLLAEYHSAGYMCHIFFCSPVDGCCTGFHVLSVVSIAALNVGVHVSFEI